MKKITLLFLLVIFGYVPNLFADNNKKIKRISEGQQNAKITIITYESLTCSHCADFHNNVYPELKAEFIDTGLVRIEFRHFPLDLAALNASKITQCINDGNSNLMHFLFSNQQKWVRGKNIEDLNKNLKNLINDEKINLDFKTCMDDKVVEDFILNDRIEGVKKFKVNATPTIIINNKKFDKPLNYKNLKKFIEKLI
jgi:protein-disulfide isomerase